MHALNASQKLLLQLLRTALWNNDEPRLTPQSVPMDVLNETQELAERHAVEGIIQKLLNTLQTQQGAQLDVLQESMQKKWRIVKTNKHINAVVKKVVDTLTAQNIGYVMIKGQGVAQRYPTPELRTPGDIDLYVGQTNYRKAIEALKPFTEKHSTEEDKHTTLFIDGIEVEIHHSVVAYRHTRDGARLQQWAEKALHPSESRTVSIDGCNVCIPSAQAESVYLFYHMWHHLFHHSGIGLRQLSDWMLTLHTDHAQTDTTILKTMLKDNHLLTDWRVFGSILVRHLGLPQTEFPLYIKGYERRADRLLRFILHTGNHGEQVYKALIESRPKGKWKGKCYTMGQFTRHYGRLFTILPRAASTGLCNYLTQGFKRIE